MSTLSRTPLSSNFAVILKLLGVTTLGLREDFISNVPVRLTLLSRLPRAPDGLTYLYSESDNLPLI